MKWSPGFRFFMVGALAALMLIPSVFVAEVISERASYSRQTIESVGREWGGAQTLGAPRLVIPVLATVSVTKNRQKTDPVTGQLNFAAETQEKQEPREPIVLYPEQFDLALDLQAEERARGVFTAPVYAADIAMGLHFDPSRATL
ncbi:MAG: inner membrane CreD family protein, partial [Pikeienuella sp.]